MFVPPTINLPWKPDQITIKGRQGYVLNREQLEYFKQLILSLSAMYSDLSNAINNNRKDYDALLIDEDNFASNLDTKAPTQQSAKAYVDGKVSDAAFAAGWDTVTTIAPSKNAVYDKIAAMISDTAFASSWDGVTGVAPSKNAVYDAIIAKTPQSAFSVTKSGSQDNIAVGSNVTVTFDTEIFDIGGDFATNTFTAPVDGKYQLNFTIRLDSTPADATYMVGTIITDNRSYSTIINVAAAINYVNLQLSALVDMDANDTAYLVVIQGAGTQQADIIAGAYTNFSGFWVCD